ncbi:hypothetical protein TL16_g05160 [Triparma laevis f. inornata]|uniref:Kinesin light chain n=1 Tax=Triparma laevis f. inornata TaxID=1714386 RepID=A0A9W7AJF7_9STRA|nr:hypothetical protein TL16_g05160 [Triparma laevis f. inornata]
MWPTSLKNLTQLASGEGFNEYFRKQFNGNEEAYLRWKEVFDVLEIGSVREVGPDLPLERQVLVITKSEDLMKLRSLAKLCSKEFFNDATLLVVAWRKILEVLVLAMPPVVDEKKARGKKKKQQRKNNDPKKLDILDACAALRVACNEVGDFEDSRRYFNRGKEGFEEQLGPDDTKTLEVTCCLILAIRMSKGELIEKLRDLWKRCERALVEENVVTLQTLNALGNKLYRDGEYEEAKEVWERCLAGRTKVLGEDHLETLMTLNNLGLLYNEGLKNNEKALEYYERVLKRYERTMGKNRPVTLMTMMNSAIVHRALKDYGKVEELYERALEGKEAQLGKEHESTKKSATNLAICCARAGEKEKLREILDDCPQLIIEQPQFASYI